MSFRLGVSIVLSRYRLCRSRQRDSKRVLRPNPSAPQRQLNRGKCDWRRQSTISIRTGSQVHMPLQHSKFEPEVCHATSNHKALHYSPSVASTHSVDASVKIGPQSPISASKAEARREIFEYIELYYNSRRVHSALGYQTHRQCGTEFERVIDIEIRAIESVDVASTALAERPFNPCFACRLPGLEDWPRTHQQLAERSGHF
jgi:hypothetical protein